MRLSATPIFALFPFALAAAACSSPPASSQANRTHAADTADTDSCTAVFKWLQKDAYKSSAGRTSDAWPPHTTTVLEVTCTDADGNQDTTSAFMQNHGTAPDAVDSTGTVILVETKREQAQGTRADLMALVDQYKQCECAPATAFLSLDTAPDDVMKKILTSVESYLQANLTCSNGVTTDAIAASIESQDYDGAIASLQNCSWNDGATMEQGLAQAAQSVLSDLQETLTDYHVCNNDAQLQAGLWESFVSSGTVGAGCDNTTAVCQGPKFFYTP